MNHRIQVPPLPPNTDRPLWSVMIPTYNCADYLWETLEGILAQDPGEKVMHVEVIDDCSTQDDPEAAVKELGGERVKFFCQPQNMGYIRNFETCLLRSQGHLIHILHGDDGVRPGFYQKLQTLFAQYPDIGLAYCRHIFMDEQSHWQRISVLEQNQSGVLSKALERIVARHPIQTPAVVVKRSVYEKLGGFDRRIQYSGEDWEMWCRIAANYAVGYESEPLALYRSHRNSLSGRSMRAGLDLQNVRKSYQMIMTYLPASQVKYLGKQAATFWALWGLNNAVSFAEIGDNQGMIAQAKEALKFDHSPYILATFAFYLGIATVKRWLGHREVEDFLVEEGEATPIKAEPEMAVSDQKGS